MSSRAPQLFPSLETPPSPDTPPPSLATGLHDQTLLTETATQVANEVACSTTPLEAKAKAMSFLDARLENVYSNIPPRLKNDKNTPYMQYINRIIELIKEALGNNPDPAIFEGDRLIICIENVFRKIEAESVYAGLLKPANKELLKKHFLKSLVSPTEMAAANPELFLFLYGNLLGALSIHEKKSLPTNSPEGNFSGGSLLDKANDLEKTMREKYPK